MTGDQIRELLIRAAEVDQKLPNNARPAKLKAMNMGYVHTFAEMNGWDEAEKHAANWAWLDPKNLRATTNDVGLWEAAMEMIAMIPDPRKRRALWAWARSEAGGQAFAKWCRDVEGITRQLGDWRKNSGIECVELIFRRKPLQHNENTDEPDFTNSPEIGDKNTNIRVMRSEDAKPIACDFDSDLNGFDWANKRNEQRRQREAKKRAAA